MPALPRRLAGVRGGPLLERAAPRDLLRRYLAAFPAIIADARARVAADPEGLRPHARDGRCGIFRRDFDPEAWLPGLVPATALLRRGRRDRPRRPSVARDRHARSQPGRDLPLRRAARPAVRRRHPHGGARSTPITTSHPCPICRRRVAKLAGAGGVDPYDLRRAYPACRRRNDTHHGDGHGDRPGTRRRALHLEA